MPVIGNSIDLITLARAQAAPVLAGVDPNLLGTLITSASMEIQNWCNRLFNQTTYTSEAYDGDGGRELLLKTQPIVTLTEVDITDIDDTVYVSPASDFYIDYGAGIIKFRKNVTGNWTIFPKGFQNIAVTYTAGFSTIPDVIQNATVELVILLNATANLDPLASAERLGEYSVDQKLVMQLMGQLPQNVQRQLGRYRSLRA